MTIQVDIDAPDARDQLLAHLDAGDPFDRLIAAQGVVENATVIIRDPQLVAYGVPTLW
jgi:PIN domain nuclease of toxin-antitoxin system